MQQIAQCWVHEEHHVATGTTARRQLEVVVRRALEPWALTTCWERDHRAIAAVAAAHHHLDLVKVQVLELLDVLGRRLGGEPL